ncbi:MAG TPA: hypothetical protein VFA34_13815 [Actinomycetota bacterium]|jgi:hypothetical protein|nr:hypothetical protein [Actinomycetota bacterium]
MASPSSGLTVQPTVLEQWRAAGGERLTYSEVAWTGTAVALIVHASLHFFSVAISGLSRLLVLFAPAERLAFGVTEGGNPLATWMFLLLAVAVWGALIGVAALAAVHLITDLVRSNA